MHTWLINSKDMIKTYNSPFCIINHEPVTPRVN